MPGARCPAGTAPHREHGQPRPLPAGPSKGAGVPGSRLRAGVSPNWGSPGGRWAWHTRVEGQEQQGGCHLDALFWWKPTCRARTLCWRRCSARVSLLLPLGLPSAGPKRRALGLVPPAGPGWPRFPLGRLGCPWPGPGGWVGAAGSADSPAAGSCRCAVGSSLQSCGVWRLLGCRFLLCAQCRVLRLYAGAKVPTVLFG